MNDLIGGFFGNILLLGIAHPHRELQPQAHGEGQGQRHHHDAGQRVQRLLPELDRVTLRRLLLVALAALTVTTQMPWLTKHETKMVERSSAPQGVSVSEAQRLAFYRAAMTRNVHTIRVEAEAARFEMRIENVPSEDNPRTGKLTALSVLACLRGLVSTLKVGS